MQVDFPAKRRRICTNNVQERTFRTGIAVIARAAFGGASLERLILTSAIRGWSHVSRPFLKSTTVMAGQRLHLFGRRA